LRDRASPVQRYQQPAKCSKTCFIDSFKLALHVAGDSKMQVLIFFYKIRVTHFSF